MGIKKELGKRIQDYRKQQNLTQERLAEIVGIDTISMSKIETGRNYPTAENLEKIAKTLNVEVYELFVFDNIKDNNTNSLNNNASKKNKLKKFNSTQYSEVLFKMIERYNIGKQKKCITFFFCYYLPSIFNRNKNNKTKIIEKISAFFEDSLSIEEIIGRKIDLENLIYFIRKKLGKESNLTNYIKILIHKDNEFKQIIEDENKNIIVNNLIKQNN